MANQQRIDSSTALYSATASTVTSFLLTRLNYITIVPIFRMTTTPMNGIDGPACLISTALAATSLVPKTNYFVLIITPRQHVFDIQTTTRSFDNDLINQLFDSVN